MQRGTAREGHDRGDRHSRKMVLQQIRINQDPGEGGVQGPRPGVAMFWPFFACKALHFTA